MRIKIIISISLAALFMNGCVIDRIKQRLQPKIAKNKDIKQEKVLYKPSKSQLQVEESFPLETEVKPKESNSKLKENMVATVNKKSFKKVASKRKKHKRNIKPKKHKAEPYSIEQNEADPELLGPQTTLKSNPLSKVTIKKESKEKI